MFKGQGHWGHEETRWKIRFKPTHPGASTRERAAVGVAEAMRELMRPGNPLLDGRVVFILGSLGAFALGMRIITNCAALGKASGEGGEGGKTNVCDETGSSWEGMVCLVGIRCEGSDVGAKIRGSGWVCVVWGGSDFMTPRLVGDGGVTGKIESVGGQRRFFMTRRTPCNGGVSKG